MKYSEKQLNDLRQEMGKRLTEKRYNHTLGVEEMAIQIGEKCLPDSIDKLRAAALLHDISKEYSEAEYDFLIKKYKIVMTDDEIAEPALWHSFTAPSAVREEFPEFADPDILSAVYNHTVGSPDMTVFDEIILLSDYIERGRKYERCVSLRQGFLDELNSSVDSAEAVIALHKAVAKSLDNNIQEFISRGKSYHKRTELTRDAIMEKTER